MQAKSPQVLCIGEALIDRLADDVGEPFQSVIHWTNYPGGAPANVACALPKLGTSSAFLGCVGSDKQGDRLLSTLAETGVNLTGVYRHPTAPTRTVYVTRTETGDRNFAGFGKQTAAFADTQYLPEVLPEKLFQSAQYLVLGSLILAELPSRLALQAALALAQQYQVECFMDLNWRPMFWASQSVAQAQLNQVLPQLDYLKLSDEEAQLFFGTGEPTAIHQRLPNLKGVFVTGGDRGSHYWVQGQAGFVPSFAVSATDTTGAGDAFVAGWLHQLCQSQTTRNIQEMAIYASAVGALTTLAEGAIAAQPSANDVQQFLAENSDRDPFDL